MEGRYQVKEDRNRVCGKVYVFQKSLRIESLINTTLTRSDTGLILMTDNQRRVMPERNMDEVLIGLIPLVSITSCKSITDSHRSLEICSFIQNDHMNFVNCGMSSDDHGATFH